MSQTDDEAWMRLALAEARRGWPGARPNPMVGSVIVRDGVCIATGFHARVGTAHAEVVALAGEHQWGQRLECVDGLVQGGLVRVRGLLDHRQRA